MFEKARDNSRAFFRLAHTSVNCLHHTATLKFPQNRRRYVMTKQPFFFPPTGLEGPGPAGVLARAQQPQQPQQPMSFFVAANPTGTGNLGGLEGADRICQNLATAA